MDVGFPVGVHVGEPLVAERAASGADCADRAQAVGVDGSESGPSHRVDELGRNPEEGDATVVDQVEQSVAVGVEGRSVVKHQGGSGCQAGGQPVPHHPTSRREVEDAVSETDVALQAVLHQVFEQDSTGPVHDAFGPTGRARGVQDVEGMVERQFRELNGVRVVGGEELLKSDGVGRQGTGRTRPGNHHNPSEVGQPVGYLDQPVGHVMVAAGVVVAVSGE